jgi:YVTN family beta-propeller protein
MINRSNRWVVPVFGFLFLISFGVISHNAFADQVVNTIPIVKQGLGDIGVNPQTNLIYVDNFGTKYSHGDTVTVIDGSTNSIVNTIQVLPSPFKIGVNPSTNMIYVPSGVATSVDVIDGSTNSVASTIRLGNYAGAVAVNPETNRIYVNNGTLQVIDGSTNSVVGSITIDNPNSPAIGNIEVNPVTNTIYVSNYGYTRADNAVTIIDGSTNTVTGAIPVRQAPDSTVTVNPNTNKIYVANDTDVVVIDGLTNSITGTISDTEADGGIASNPNTNKIYVANHDRNTVTVIDGSVNIVTATIPVGNGPDAVAINVKTNKIYVANQADNTISVIDGNTNIVTTSQLQVNSKDSFGNMLEGYYAELYANNGTQIDSGYTPNNFTLNNGENYTVHVENYGNYKFNHWQDTGSNDANRTMSITSDDSITAVYATIPTHPTNLTATAISSSQINLSWNAPSSDEGSPITGYRIQSSTDGSTWSTIVKNTGSTDTTYSDTGLEPNTTHYYRVFALNSVGSSYRSNVASATTPMLNVAGIN